MALFLEEKELLCTHNFDTSLGDFLIRLMGITIKYQEVKSKNEKHDLLV